MYRSIAFTSLFDCNACPSCIAVGTMAHVKLALADDKELRAPFFSSSVEWDFGPCHPRIFSVNRKLELNLKTQVLDQFISLIFLIQWTDTCIYSSLLQYFYHRNRKVSASQINHCKIFSLKSTANILDLPRLKQLFSIFNHVLWRANCPI